MKNIRYILTDIEGTTSSVNFVYDCLFPYFIQHIRHFLSHPPPGCPIEELLGHIAAKAAAETNAPFSSDGLVAILTEWTRQDRKDADLKALQGLLWEQGYRSGTLKGHVYADVPPALCAWKEAGITTGIFSSGSIRAQRLLFGYSVYRDLSDFFTDHFDTAVGPKRVSSSYAVISGRIGVSPPHILFISDVEAELDAAREAGFLTVQMIREGAAAGTRHPIATDFLQIKIEQQ